MTGSELLLILLKTQRYWKGIGVFKQTVDDKLQEAYLSICKSMHAEGKAKYFL